MAVDPQRFLAAALGGDASPSSPPPPVSSGGGYAVDPQSFLQAALAPDPEAEARARQPFLPPPIPGVAEGIEAELQFGNGTRTQPTVLEQLGGVGRAVVTGGQQLLGGLGTALETAGQGMQQPGITGGALAGVPLEAIGQVLSQGAEQYQANAYPAELERQAMAEQSPLWGYAQDVAAQVPQIAAAMAAGGGAPALALLGASAAGQGIQQAEAEGATPGEAVAYGTASGVIEAATERIGTIPLVDKILKRAITGPVVKGGALKRVLADISRNFGEEFAASVGNEIAAVATYQEGISPDALQKAVYSGLVGAGLGGGVSAMAEVANRGAAPEPPPPVLPTEAPVEAPQAAPPVVEAPVAQEAPPPTPEPIRVPQVEPLPPQPEVVPQAPPVAVEQAPKPTRKRKAGPSPEELAQLQAEAAPVEQAPPPPTPPAGVARDEYRPSTALIEREYDTRNPPYQSDDDNLYVLRNAALPKGDTLEGIHVTDDPTPVVEALRSKRPISQGRGGYDAGDLGGGLYFSQAPEIWESRSREKWSFLGELTDKQRSTLADALSKRIAASKASRYITAIEAEAADETIAHWRAGTISLQSITQLAAQPYNERFWQPEFLEPLGIDPGKMPQRVPVKVKGKFAKLSRDPVPSEVEELRKAGYDGAYTTGGFSTTPQFVVWNNDAVVQFGDYSKQEAQNAEAAQADVAETGRPAPDQIPVAAEAGRPAPAAVLEETPDALRRKEGRQEGREAVAETPAQPVAEPTPSPAPAEPIAIESKPESGRAGTPKGSGIVAGAAADEVKGMASTSSVPYMKMPVNLTAPPAAPSEPLGTQGVLAGLNKIWDVPIRFRHFRKKAQAIFKTRPEVVRMKDAGDLPASAHEIAHYIDKTRPGLIQGAHKAATTELITLGKRLYSTGQHTLDFYKSEGFAEYVRHRLTRDDAAQEAPEFDLYFNGAVAGDAELTQKLDASKQLYNQWRGQAPIERAKGQIDFDQELGKLPPKERAAEVGRQTVSAMLDSWAPLDRYTKEMVERAGLKREDLPAASDPYRLMAAFQGSESSIARQMMLYGVRDAEGTIIAGPVKEAMAKVKADDYRDFFAYALAKRTLELEPKGKETGLSVEDAREIVKAHETPEWEAAVKGLNAYANGLVDILQGAGALTDRQAAKIKESEWYIPLTRVYEAESGGRLASAYPGKPKQAAGGGEQPIQKLKGSQRPIQDPMLSLAQLTERVISASTRAKVFRAVYGLQNVVEGAGDIVEEVDPPKVPTSFTLDKIRKQLEDMGIDVPADADGDALLTIFSNSAFPTGSDPIVTGVVNGERKFLYVKDPLLYQSLANLPPPWLEATRLLWPLRKLASGVRLGATGLNPGFGLVTNFIRDAWTGTLQTLTNPGSFVIRMARSAGKDTEADKLFYAGGGEMATPLGVDIKPFRKLKREIAAQTTMDEVLLKVRHPVDWLRDLIAFTETFGRRAEFRRIYDETLKKTGDKESAWVAAQEAASEVTVNFRRAGIYGRALNQIIPFFNVAIQGPRAGAKAIARNPSKAFLTATASLTVPALALYALHRDEEWYQEIPLWEKAIFLHFKVGNQIVRLPLPFEWGIVFATLPIAALDRLRTGDKARFEESYGAMLDTISPDTLPAGFRQAYEWNANINLLTGRAIESERLQQLLPEDRYYASTSEAYKKVGKMLGLSPVKIQNTMEGLTGGLSRTFTDPMKAARAREAADIPVIGRLFSRQLRTGQSVTDIYNESENAERVYASILKALDEQNQKQIDRLENKYQDLLGVNPEGVLQKGATRERYPRLYLLRDAKKVLKEAKGMDDPKLSTAVARVMLGRTRLEDLSPEIRKKVEDNLDLPEDAE